MSRNLAWLMERLELGKAKQKITQQQKTNLTWIFRGATGMRQTKLFTSDAVAVVVGRKAWLGLREVGCRREYGVDEFNPHGLNKDIVARQKKYLPFSG
jgi:hypothetical protein